MSLPKNVTGYRFIDKDPWIDLFRTARQKTGMSFAEIFEKGGPTVETLRRWESGTTRRPLGITRRFAMAAMGYEEVYIDREGNTLRARYTKEAIKADNVVVFRKAG